MTMPAQPDSQCAGQPPIRRHRHIEPVADPTGPQCRHRRRARAGAPRRTPCPHPALATAHTPRTRSSRLCVAHTRLLADRAGPSAITLDQPPR